MPWTPYIAKMSEHLGIHIDFSMHPSAAFQVGTRQFFLLWAEDTQSFLLYREIGHLTPHIGGELAKDLLAANFLLTETAGAALSYEKSDNMVGINKTLPIASLSPQDFLVQINDFFTLAEVWEGQMTERTRVHTQKAAHSAPTTVRDADNSTESLTTGSAAFLKV